MEICEFFYSFSFSVCVSVYIPVIYMCVCDMPVVALYCADASIMSI